jgi:hypothetical protein
VNVKNVQPSTFRYWFSEPDAVLRVNFESEEQARAFAEAAAGQVDVPAAMLIFGIGRRGGRWIVRLYDKIYGEYLNREQACLDAIEAASEARDSGIGVEVWDRSTNTRVF